MLFDEVYQQNRLHQVLRHPAKAAMSIIGTPQLQS